MAELIVALLANAQFRAELVVLIEEVFRRRTLDPDYLAKSDAAFALRANAKTESEKNAAQDAILALLNP